MKVQTIATPNGERLIVIPEANYHKLVEIAEDAQDRRVVDAFHRDLDAGGEEFVPAAVADRLLDGESRIKVWREHRGMTSKALADIVGIAPGFLSQIETGKRSGTIETMQAIAAVLRLSIEDLIDAQQEPAHLQIATFLADGIARTPTEIADALGFSESHIRKCCEWLAKTSSLKRLDDPVRYRR